MIWWVKSIGFSDDVLKSTCWTLKITALWCPIATTCYDQCLGKESCHPLTVQILSASPNWGVGRRSRSCQLRQSQSQDWWLTSPQLLSTHAYPAKPKRPGRRVIRAMMKYRYLRCSMIFPKPVRNMLVFNIMASSWLPWCPQLRDFHHISKAFAIQHAWGEVSRIIRCSTKSRCSNGSGSKTMESPSVHINSWDLLMFIPPMWYCTFWPIAKWATPPPYFWQFGTWTWEQTFTIVPSRTHCRRNPCRKSKGDNISLPHTGFPKYFLQQHHHFVGRPTISFFSTIFTRCLSNLNSKDCTWNGHAPSSISTPKQGHIMDIESFRAKRVCQTSHGMGILHIILRRSCHLQGDVLVMLMLFNLKSNNQALLHIGNAIDL